MCWHFRESSFQILNPYKQGLKLQCFLNSWIFRFVLVFHLSLLLIYFLHAIVLWKQGVHFIVLLLDSSYAYILSFPYYHVIVRHGVHIMTNVPIFWQVDSLKAKLFEKLEQSLQDVHLNTEDIINVLEDSNDTSNPTTANDVSRRKNYCF